MKKDRMYKQYHPAFCSAMELELREDREHLKFEREYTLNSKPNTVDLLIISRDEGYKVKSRLGSIFRKYNICEYKRPNDTLDDIIYHRAMGYGYLSVAYIDEIMDMDEVTISFVRETFPRNLISWLVGKEFNIMEYEKGIYHITRDYHVVMQIIVSGLLGEEYKWINKLTSKLEKDDFIRMGNELKKYNDKIDIINAESVIDLGLSLNKNKKSVEEMIGMGWFIEEREKMRHEQEMIRQEGEKVRQEGEKVRQEGEKLRQEEARFREREARLLEREKAVKDMQDEHDRMFNEVNYLRNQIKELTNKIAML